MKKLKKNWKKILSIVVGTTLGLILIVGIGVFLWMQTWKTFRFPSNEISIKYPQSDSVLYTPSVENFGELNVNSGNNDFNLTIDTTETDRGCKNSLETCVNSQDIVYLQAVHGLTEKSIIKFHGLDAYLLDGYTTAGYEKLLILYFKNTVYTFLWTNNPQNILENIFNQIKINLIFSFVNFNN
ncbi:MAG TPA: hypothetical protein VG895_01615 [Patescibacteria group bacterium]|nr:hypothetical protein [Patescibacteria group bacterium]